MSLTITSFDVGDAVAAQIKARANGVAWIAEAD